MKAHTNSAPTAALLLLLLVSVVAESQSTQQANADNFGNNRTAGYQERNSTQNTKLIEPLLTKIVHVMPTAMEAMVHAFDQVLVLFAQSESAPQYSVLYEAFSNASSLIRGSYPQDKTLFAVCNIADDIWNKLQRYNGTIGIRLIKRQKVYVIQPLGFPTGEEGITVEQDAQRRSVRAQAHNIYEQYRRLLHPDLQLAYLHNISLFYSSFQPLLLFQFNESAVLLQNYTKAYSKVHEMLSEISVRSVAVPGEVNRITLFYKSARVVYFGDAQDSVELFNFVNVQSLPLVSRLEEGNFYRIFGSQLDMQLLLVYQKRHEYHPEIVRLRHQLLISAQHNKNAQLYYERVLFCEGDAQYLSTVFESDVLLDSGSPPSSNLSPVVSQNESPAFSYRLLMTQPDYDRFQLLKFNYEEAIYGKITNETVIQFMQDVRKKRVEPQYKSQSIPLGEHYFIGSGKQTASSLSMTQYNSVIRIVGESFISEVFNRPQESIVVLFVDSRHQQGYLQLVQTLEQLLDKHKYQFEGRLRVGIMDLSRNEHKLLTIRETPQLVLFQRSNKKHARLYGMAGPKELIDIQDWLVRELTHVQLDASGRQADLTKQVEL